ncbi:MAG: TonB-dependent receptor, partial [Saprospiraceae bacterium]|nr:TonB-dependent receptor [Saprospiraceae bacterium]
VVSGTENATDFNQFLLPDYTRRKEFETVSKQTKTTLSTVLSHKFNAKHYIRTGAYVNFLNFDFTQGSYQLAEEQFRQELDQTGQTQTVDGFFQWQYRPTSRVTFNLGAHGLAMLLNNRVSLEPRASLRYAHNPKHAFSIGYGLHGQIPTLGVYFVKDVEGQLLNPDLDIQKSHHLVFSYDYSPVKNLRLKSELYYQRLFNIGVERDKTSSFSLLNEIDGIAFRELNNSGLGRNYGLEFTAEQFLTRGLYFLASVSLYRSEYRGSDEEWRSSRFDGKFATSFTAGKEWDWSRKGKNRSFGVNIKLLGTGGQKATPIDLTASIARGETVYIDDQAFTNQQPAYFRLDTGFRLKRNYKHLTTTVSLDIQNTTNRANYGGEFYNPFTQKVESWSQGPLIPVLAYRLEF